MKINYLLFIFFFAGLHGEAQIFGGASANIYVNHESMDVMQDIDLKAATSNIHLRNNDQFLQGNTGISANKAFGSMCFKKETLGFDEARRDNFTIYLNNDLKLLVIKNPHGLGLKSCTVYDVTGKPVLTHAGFGNKDRYQMSTANLAEGVYIVKLITDNNQEFSKKVSIYRTR